LRKPLKNYSISKAAALLLFFVLAACSKQESSNNDAVLSGVIKLEATYPSGFDFESYQIRVFTAAGLFDLTKVSLGDTKLFYQNDGNKSYSFDSAEFPLVSGNSAQVFSSSDYALSLSMLITASNTSTELEENIPVNLKIYFNNSLQEDVDVMTTKGGFDFTWTPKGFVYDGN